MTGPTPADRDRCVVQLPVGRCRGRRLPGADRCIKHECAVGFASGATRRIEPEVEHDRGDLRLLQDPVYAERVRHWLGDPKRLLDYRHTMARCQALADCLEDRVRRAGRYGEVPPPLLYAIDELRKMHLAIARLDNVRDETKYIHVDLVDALVGNVVAVISEFVEPEWVPAALDKLYALQEAAVPGAVA